MRSIIALLLAALMAFSGCLSDDEPTVADDEPEDTEPAAPEPTTEDMGEYILDLETGLCHAKEGTYSEDAPGVYQSNFGGGTWVFQETNDVPGLQYEDNHPASGTGQVFELAVDERCTNGDQANV